MNFEIYRRILEKSLNTSVKIESIQPVGGGCICDSKKIQCNQGDFFIKISKDLPKDLFQKEVYGLEKLQSVAAIRIPNIQAQGELDGNNYLVLGWIEKGRYEKKFWVTFGRQVANLHKNTQKEFGLDHSNYIGKLSQSNQFHRDWIDFFILERITPQLKLADNKGYKISDLYKRFNQLFSKLEHLIPKEQPSLLHGDLWSGNFMCDHSNLPVVFDPSVYYGHREVELAFSMMFGGFDSQFYDAYQEVLPLEKTFVDRIDLHNLYPLLVHTNLFGNTYLHQVISILNRYTK